MSEEHSEFRTTIDSKQQDLRYLSGRQHGSNCPRHAGGQLFVAMTSREPRVYLSRRQVLGALVTGAGCSLVPAAFISPSTGHAAMNYDDGLPRISPGEAGVDPRAVLDFIDRVFAKNLQLHSFMLFRGGHVVAEGWSWPYRRNRPHMMHSLTKSVTACGVGIAIDEGNFSLDDKVISFFPDELPAEVNENLEAMTVRDLLTMQSGHAKSVSGSVFRQIDTSWVAEFFRIPVVFEPGSHFVYSSALSFMLSAIVTATTGQSVREYLEPRVFRPSRYWRPDLGCEPEWNQFRR